MHKGICIAVLGGLIGSVATARADVEFYRDVMPLIQAKCIVCHSEQGVSFSYEDPDQAYVLRMAIASAVADGRMPPWLAEAGHQEYVGDYSLTAGEKAMMAEWADAGYPRAATAVAASVTEAGPRFEADLTLAVLPGSSYLPNQTRKDDYRCFIIDWPYETDKYVTGFLATPGNLRVAHHLVTFMVGPDSADFLKTLSDAEEGPGHQCFGGALPDRFGDENERRKLKGQYPDQWERLVEDNYWLSHWAPGMYGEDFPDGTGILIRPGSLIVVQMHYFSAFAPGESDEGTLMHFKLADAVDKPSINLPLTNNRWLYGERNDSMLIPPGETETYETGEDFEGIARYAAAALSMDYEEVSAIELQSANVHMHAIGASGNASLLDSDGHKEILLNIPRWDLAWQRDFMFRAPKVVARSEFAETRLVVECTFTNHTDDVVYGGYGSDDEMCFNFSYVSVVPARPGDDAVSRR